MTGNPSEFIKPYKVKLDPQTNQFYFYDPTHPLAGKSGKVLLHRHILSLKLRRWLKPNELVVFLDGNLLNVFPENLAAISREDIEVLMSTHRVLVRKTHHQKGSHILPSLDRKEIHFPGDANQEMPTSYIAPDELQELVWDLSIDEISRLFGIPVREIRRHCREYGIQLPPRGYRSKVGHRTSPNR